MQTSPEVNAPTSTPTSGFIALNLEGALTCFLERSISQVISREEAYQMALMAMLEIPVIPIIIPLIQVAHVSDGIGMKFSQCLLHLLIFLSKNLACSNGIDKEFTDDGQIGSTAIASSSMIALVRFIFVFW